MCQEIVYGSPSDAVKPIPLKNFRIHGVAAGNAKAGDKLAVLVRAEITSDQPEFHLFMQGITNLLLGKASEHGVLIQMDRVCAFLVVTHKDGTADLYLQDFPVQAEMMSKRDVAKGEAVYQNGIADIRRLRMPWLTLKPDDGVLYCFKVGWKFALFFDLDPGRELDVDAMERSLGRLYRRLLFQGLYEALESEEAFGKLIVEGWFPFIETIGGEFEKLLKAYKNDFNVEDETRTLIQRFDAKRTLHAGLHVRSVRSEEAPGTCHVAPQRWTWWSSAGCVHDGAGSPSHLDPRPAQLLRSRREPHGCKRVG